MGYVQQAVLEFDQEVQAPWRPRLVAVPDAAVRDLRGHAGGLSGSGSGAAPCQWPNPSARGRRS